MQELVKLEAVKGTPMSSGLGLSQNTFTTKVEKSNSALSQAVYSTNQKVTGLSEDGLVVREADGTLQSCQVFSNNSNDSQQGNDQKSIATGRHLTFAEFDREFSSPKLEVSPSGLTVTSTDKSQRAVWNMPMREGTHYWEIICPIRLAGLSFGVTTRSEQVNKAGVPMKYGTGSGANTLYCGRYVGASNLPGSDGSCGPNNGPCCQDCQNTIPVNFTQTFHSSSERVVGVELNLDTMELRYFIQSRYCKKQKCKKLETKDKKSLENLEWYPIVEFKETNNTVIFNPWKTSPCPETTTVQQKSKIPVNLGFDIVNIKASLMDLLVGNRMIVHHTFTDKVDINELLTKLTSSVTSQVEVKDGPKTTLYLLVESKSRDELFETAKQFKARVGWNIVAPHVVSKLLMCYLQLRKSNSFSVTLLLSNGTVMEWLNKQLIEKFDKTLFETIIPTCAAFDEKVIFELQPKAQTSSPISDLLIETSNDKTVVAHGNQLKIVADNSDMTLFSNYPKAINDKVYLTLNLKDLHFLVRGSDLPLTPQLTHFFEQVVSSFDGHRCHVSYIDALVATQTYLRHNIQRYQKIEQLTNEVYINDSVKNQTVKKIAQSKEASLSHSELNLLLSICVDLEDQLWSMCQGEEVPLSVKEFWPPQVARTHTAYGRLHSLLQLNDSEKPLVLAELGLLNEADKRKQYFQFQEPYTPIEDLHSSSNLIDCLEKQIPTSLLLKGLSTWNVKLAQTLNQMPPVQHLSGCKKQRSEGKVSQIFGVGNFVMSANYTDSSVNIFSQKMGLTRLLSHNFKAQAFNQDAKPSLLHNEFKKIFDSQLVKVMSKRVQSSDEPIFDESALKPVEESDNNEFSMLGDLFQEEQAKDEMLLSEDSDNELYNPPPEQESLYKLGLIQPASKTESPPTPGEVPKPPQAADKKQQEKDQQQKKINELKEKAKVELLQLSFSPAQIEAAFKQAKTFSTDELLDIIVTLGPIEEPKPKKEPEGQKITWKVYNCQQCTYLNEENPGPKCCICEFDAPADAKVVSLTKEQQEEIQRQKRKEEDEQKQKELEAKQAAAQKEQEEAKEKLRKETLDYYNNVKLTSVMAASVKGGKAFRPAIFAGLLQGDGIFDLHIKFAKYRQNYVKDHFSNFIEDLYNRQHAVESFIPSTLIQRNRQEVMRVQELAVVSIKLDTVTTTFQVGNDISDNRKWHIVVVGKKEGKETAVVISIDTSGNIKITESMSVFEGVSKGVSFKERLLVQKDNELILYNVLPGLQLSVEKLDTKQLNENEKLMNQSNGVASIRSGPSVRLIDFCEVTKAVKPLNKVNEVPISTTNPASILDKQIDRSKITVDEIDRYERMMLGDGCKGKSNSSQKQHLPQSVRHTWQLIGDETGSSKVLEVELNEPTSLIQLNLDVQFKCTNMDSLVSQLDIIPTVNTANPTNSEQKNEQPKLTQNVGAFSLKGLNEDKPSSSQQNSKQAPSFLPLIVKRNKGSCYSLPHQPSKMLLDNEQMFASNYAKPEIVFAHTEEQKMVIDQITLKTLTISKTGAFPLGEGMIFLSDTLQPFDQVDAFSKFTLSDYNKWKQERVKDLRPMRPTEPCAYFQCDENIALTFELDVKRAARYIMLLPTGFRQKPQQFIQHVAQVPMEIQFFGVTGEVVESEERVLDSIEVNDTAQNLHNEIMSGVDLEVTLVNRVEESKFVIENARVNQIMVGDKNVSAQTLVQNKAVIQSHINVEGQSLNRISDSRLKLQQVEKIRVRILPQQNANWQLSHASIECIKAKVASQVTKNDEPLFQNTDISNYHYRQCLLDPLFFNVVNKQIVSVISDPKVSQRLRQRAIQFLTSIAKKEPRIHQLILKEIDFRQLLITNMFAHEQEIMIPIAAEFLKCFQTEQSFLQNLYTILVQEVKTMPGRTISYSGYQALIALLNWVLPLDSDQTLKVLVETLCKDVLQKISGSQSNDHTLYRTRYHQSDMCEYPFDTLKFQPRQTSSSQGQSGESQLKKRDDIIHEVMLELSGVKTMQHSMKLKFHTEVELNMLKLYFSNPKAGGNYTMQVEVAHGDNIIYAHQYPIQAFHQYVQLPYESKAQKDCDYALSIGGLSNVVNEVKVVVTYQSIQSNIDPRATEYLPMLMVEPYGKIPEQERAKAQQIHSATLKACPTQQQYSVGRSFSSHIISDKAAKELKYLPVLPEAPSTSVPKSEPAKDSPEQKDDDVQEVQKSTHELEQLQTSLRLLLKTPSESQKREVSDLVAKIQKYQLVKGEEGAQCMHYLVTMANDFSRLIQHMQGQGRDLKPYFNQAGSLSTQFCLQYFEHLVVNESAKAQTQPIQFLKNCLLSMLDQPLRDQLTCQIIDKFLSEPVAHISQKAVLNALTQLGYNSGVLIEHLQTKFTPCLTQSGKQAPLVMVFSVLSLVQSNYEKLKPIVAGKSDQIDESNHNNQYEALFTLVYLICKNEHNVLSKSEQIALLTHLMKALAELSKVVDYEVLLKLLEQKENMQTINIDFICYQNSKIEEYIAKSHIQIIDRFEFSQPKTEKSEKVAQQLITFVKAQGHLFAQVLMTWLVEFKLGQTEAATGHKKKLFDLCETDSAFWLTQVNHSIDQYLTAKKHIEKIEKFLGASQEESDNSTLLPVIKSLISMLSKQTSEENTLQIWSLALRSLRTIDVDKLIESQILEEMINAFLTSNEKIQQTTYTQILRISEQICQGNKDGRFLTKLLFKTFASVDPNQVRTQTADSVISNLCQGLIDLILIGHLAANSKSALAETRLSETTIYCSLEAQDILELLQQLAQYLSHYLNQGNFEGASGAHINVVMRLQIASDILIICKRAQSQTTKRLAIQDLFTQCQEKKETRTLMGTVFDQLIGWLFLSGRLEAEEKDLEPIAPSSLKTPGSLLAKSVTQSLKDVLVLVSDCNSNTEVIQIALASLTKVVRTMNKAIVQRTMQEKLSFFVGVKLTNRTNQLFIKLLQNWLVSDQLVEYFVFSLKGFDFLLDTISTEPKESDNQIVEESKEQQSAFAGSDLESLFLEAKSKELAQPAAQREKDVEDTFQASLIDLAKNKFLLQETSGNEPITNAQTIDWPVNKKAYKHKVYNKNIKDQRGYLEHEMLFKLNQPSVVREIQIAFANYWATDSEVVVEPSTVLVQGGLDKENLKHICTLEVLHDPAFLSVQATIFAKNMQEYEHFSVKSGDIADVIQAKIESIENFKCQWLKFSMRRNTFSCIENSPLANRLVKPAMLSINYISMQGYAIDSIKSNVQSFIVKEQKKAALQVMSMICSGEFSNVLKVIANQEETIQKIKNQFQLLSSMVDDKQSMIEPTFISIATHNEEMGDWIIQKFITTAGYEKHASLCGKIIICDKAKVVHRLALLREKILDLFYQLKQSASGQIALAQRISPFVDIYIKIIHLVASELDQKQEIDLNVAQEVIIQNLMDTMATNQVDFDPQFLKKVLHFLALVLSPPQPFTNTAINQTQFAEYLLSTLSSERSEDQTNIKLRVISLLAPQNSQIANLVLKQLINQVNEGLLTWTDPQSLNFDLATRWATFWINCTADAKVKARLQEDELPLKLYSLLKETDPEGKKRRIVKLFPEEYLTLIVELIIRVSTGHQKLENELTNALIKDLDLLQQIRDMNFINKVLLPMIRNEGTVPVCMIEKNQSDHWAVNMDSLSIGGQSDKQQKHDYTKFVPSDLIDSELRGPIIKGFKEIVGKVSSSTAKNVLSCNWWLAKTILSEQQVGEFPELWKSIQNKGPMVMLIKGKNSTGKKYLFGGFCSKQMPPAPFNFDQDQDLPVSSSDEDFLFVHIQGEGFFFFKPNNNIILEFFTDYESNGAISMGSDFMQISMSYDFRLTVGQTSALNQIFLQSVPDNKSGAQGLKHFQGLLSGDHASAFQVERAEIWIGNGDKKVVAQSSEKPKGLIQKVLTQIQIPPQSQEMHPWLNYISPLNYYRSRPIFFVPAHLTVAKAAEILLCLNQEAQKSINITASTISQIDGETKIGTIYEEFLAQPRAQKMHNILDLSFLIDDLNSSVLMDEDPTDIVQHVQSSYMPNNVFFDQFEQQGGVKTLIKGTLSSIQEWKDQKSAESWKLWLQEVQSFAEIPSFFKAFFKNRACKELLFQVLAGDPDTNNDSRKWEQEQKDAVQVNYKILAEIFAISNNNTIRDSAIQAGFLDRILERLGAISGEKARQFEEEEEAEAEEEVKQPTLEKKDSSVDRNKTRAKRQGVGYTSQNKHEQTFNVTAYLDNKKQRNEQIKTLVDICHNFFKSKTWVASNDVLQIILESPLLPLLESAFRNGSWLDMAKEAPVYHSYMALTRSLAQQENLIGLLIEIDKKWKPVQTMPIYKLLGKLNELATIFLQCLSQQATTNETRSRKEKKKISFEEKKVSDKQELAIEYFEPLNQYIVMPKLSPKPILKVPATVSLAEMFKTTFPKKQSPKQMKKPNIFGGSSSSDSDSPHIKAMKQKVLNEFGSDSAYSIESEEIKKPEPKKATIHSNSGSIDEWHSVQSGDEETKQNKNVPKILNKEFQDKIQKQIQEDLLESSYQNTLFEPTWLKPADLLQPLQPPKTKKLISSPSDSSGPTPESSPKQNKKSEENKSEDWVSCSSSGSDYDDEDDYLSKESDSSQNSVHPLQPLQPLQPLPPLNSVDFAQMQPIQLQMPTETVKPCPLPNIYSSEDDDHSKDWESDHSSYYNESLPKGESLPPLLHMNPLQKDKSQAKLPPLSQSSHASLYQPLGTNSTRTDNNPLSNVVCRDQTPEKLARDVTKTFQIVQSAVEEILADQSLRYDTMDMKQGESDYKHHYKSMANQNQNPPQTKMVRLAQELADLSNALPSEHTNAVFVRCDKSRVDMMKAVITGAVGTPYAHGCYEFDLFCENSYPNGPPKMNLMTTGNGQIRFNPNLYACGKVCLSLLGTWRGSATENWDAKLSTILQVLLSTQAIIMSEEVYFNEPGFENEAGTPDGEKRNEGYMNIVRYGNVKWAMLGQIKKPSKGFESAIKRHFYIKKEEILIDVHKWVERADKVDCLFTGLVSDHNHTIAKDFQKSKTRYREALAQVVKELEDELNKLEKPTNYQIKPKIQKKKVNQQQKNVNIQEGKQDLTQVDMSDDTFQIDTNSKEQDIDVDDEKVKDRWSRYIGAMGVEAVSKQAKAQIFLSGASALGIEIAKNMVLAGCKSFTLHDTEKTSTLDLSGQFFLQPTDIGKNRVEACINRLQQLNFYVKCKTAPNTAIPLTEEELVKEPWSLHQYDVVVLTNQSYETNIAVNNFCRKNGKKFISIDCYGLFGRVFNDFGESFEVLDKNGEELQDCMIKSISNEEQALVELIPNAKHKFEDGDEVHFVGVEGMKLLEGQSQPEANKEVKSGSINETIWKVKTKTPYSFYIGDTRMYEKYENQGIAKQLRTKMQLKMKSFADVMTPGKECKFEDNLIYADPEKFGHSEASHVFFQALDQFKQKNKGELPKAWDAKDTLEFVSLAKELNKEWSAEKFDEVKNTLLLACQFALTCRGVFNPLTAFFGGFVAQEIVKAITNKFTPCNQTFYYNACEVCPEFELTEAMLADEAAFTAVIKKYESAADSDRYEGLSICVGSEICDKLKYTKLFMVGAGAIGCELLKNYAMLGVGTGKATKDKQAGQIVLTDPDIIEVSNLNRQFLFREKHLRKPKSQTAAAAAIYMNSDLKDNIIARLDKVHDGTANIFTDKFFEDQSIVTNALDNVMARKYIDQRCVTAKTPLIESGTLGPKGHVQVILPYQTETYGQQQDPEDNNEVPFCTLKMFPEETLHCVEWARDKFGRMFTQLPQSLIKLLEEGDKFQPESQQDLTALKEGLKMLKKRPTSWMDCIEYARMKFEKLFNHDIRQLLHVYPLDSVTKEGNKFWTLPKRPPQPIEFDKANPLHQRLVASMACLRATIFHIQIPSDQPRSDALRKEVAESAAFFKPKAFVPNDAKAKEIQDQVDKAGKKDDEEKKDDQQEEQDNTDETETMLKEFKKIFATLKLDKTKSIEETFIQKEEFEKDCDRNFHIDIIYALANCRASNYKLEEMDWLTVKLKAGRIVPALATTTACIAGLQTLEMLKTIKKCKKVDHRNVFLNLAVPILQVPEPGDVMKDKLLDDLEVSIWDRWEIKEFKQKTLQHLFTQVEEMHKNRLQVIDVMRGNAIVYFKTQMEMEQNKGLRKKTLGTPLCQLLEAEGEPYVDLTITMKRKPNEEQQINTTSEKKEDDVLAYVPPLRVYF